MDGVMTWDQIRQMLESRRETIPQELGCMRWLDVDGYLGRSCSVVNKEKEKLL
jgi:hypothetical protein